MDGLTTLLESPFVRTLPDSSDQLTSAGAAGYRTLRCSRTTGLQARRVVLEQELGRRSIDLHRFDLRALETRMRAKLDDWRNLLRRNVQDARAVLRALLVGPLRFTPIVEDRRRGYAFRGTIALDRLLAGVVDLPTVVASPTGFGADSDVQRTSLQTGSASRDDNERMK